MIVVDASVVVSALADDGPDGDRARDRLRGEQLVAPQLLDVEVLSAWRRIAAGGGLDPRRSALARRDLDDLAVERVGHRPLLDRSWELRESLTIYDAVYVALAEMIDAVLVTADAKLARSTGPRCAIELIR